MEREELSGLVSEELGDVTLTLSEQTINEELDDELENFGDDAEANSKLVTKIANRLKRLDGNLHKDVSTQVSEYKKQVAKRGTQSAKRAVRGSGEEDEQAKAVRELREEIEALKTANAERRTAEARKAVLKDVEKGLRDKFEKAGMKVNGYFLRAALGGLSVPEKDADVKELVEKAEKSYNADMKEAGVDAESAPRFGGGGGGGSTSVSEFFARKAKKEGWGKK